MSLKVYISSSWKRREAVRQLATLLQNAGFETFDFTNPEQRTHEEIPPERFPEQFDPAIHVYREYIDRPEWRNAVEENQRWLDWCDVVVLLLPCGLDAHSDWAYAVGKGKLTVILGHPPAGERTPTHMWAEQMFESTADLLGWLRQAERVTQ